MFDSRIRLVYLCLCVFLSSVCLLQYFWPFTSENVYDPSLHNLALRLRDAGLRFRAVSPRHDGLATTAIYLTQTDLDDMSIRSLVLDPSQLHKWHGTVMVFCEGDNPFRLCVGDDWNNCAYRYGQFTFFGDKELLDEIASKLGSASAEMARDRPAIRPVSCSE